MRVPFLQDSTFTGLISTRDYKTSQEWSQAYSLIQTNSALWSNDTKSLWGSISGTLSAQSDLWSYLSAGSFNSAQLTAFLATNSITLCSIDVRGQILSAGSNLFNIFLTNRNAANSYLPLSGGTITGPLYVLSSLYVAGSAFYVQAQDLIVKDPIIYIAEDNQTDFLDIGIIASWTNAPGYPTGYQHGGLIRRADNKAWTLFSGATAEPLSGLNVQWSQAGIQLEPLSAKFYGDIYDNRSVFGNLRITNGLTVAGVVSGLGNPTTSFNSGSATGNLSFAIGAGRAFGQRAFAAGNNTRATASNSVAFGSSSLASGTTSKASGTSTQATNTNANAEGSSTLASGAASHAEGTGTDATANNAHAEGLNTEAVGSESHAEGDGTYASGNDSHAEGRNTNATGNRAHAEGLNTTASGDNSHAEGDSCFAGATNAHAEGYFTRAEANHSHAEGVRSRASGPQAHAEGRDTIASGSASHAQGNESRATGQTSFAAGQTVHAQGSSSIAMGVCAIAAHNDSFIWSGDPTVTIPVSTTCEGQFYINAPCGVYIAGDLTVTGSVAGVIGVASHSQYIGDGINNTFTINHGLSTLNVQTQVFDASNNTVVYPLVQVDTLSSINVFFEFVPSPSAYKVLVFGAGSGGGSSGGGGGGGSSVITTSIPTTGIHIPAPILKWKRDIYAQILPDLYISYAPTLTSTWLTPQTEVWVFVYRKAKAKTWLQWPGNYTKYSSGYTHPADTTRWAANSGQPLYAGNPGKVFHTEFSFTLSGNLPAPYQQVPLTAFNPLEFYKNSTTSLQVSASDFPFVWSGSHYDFFSPRMGGASNKYLGTHYEFRFAIPNPDTSSKYPKLFGPPGYLKVQPKYTDSSNLPIPVSRGSAGSQISYMTYSTNNK
jgi:hypothetical protein